MWDWIGSFLSGWLGIPITGSMLKDTITRIVNTFMSLFNGWIGWVGWFSNSFVLLVGKGWLLWVRIVDKIEYTLLVRIPNAVEQAFLMATQWAATEVNAARDFLSQWISNVEQRAAQLFDNAVQTAFGWVSELRDFIVTLWTDFQTVKTRVVQLLTDPGALADWIAGAIIGAVGRWIVGNAAALGRYLLAHAITDTEWLASFLEDVVMRIL